LLGDPLERTTAHVRPDGEVVVLTGRRSARLVGFDRESRLETTTVDTHPQLVFRTVARRLSVLESERSATRARGSVGVAHSGYFYVPNRFRPFSSNTGHFM
jgi:hypothetical protein